MIALLVVYNAGALGPFALIGSLLSLFTIIMIFTINYADFVLFPLFTGLLGIKITPAKGYYIPKNSNTVIKYVNGIYYATGYLTANIYNYVFAAESVDEEEEAKLGEAPDKWERIVMNAGFPFRLNFVSMAEDIQKFREELEGKRGAIEYQMSKEMSSSNPSQLAIQDLQRKMNVIDARINRLSAGERPVNAIMYIETTAVGVSEKESMDLLTNQLNHLQTLFNAFDLNITRIPGRELFELFSFNYVLPDKIFAYLLSTAGCAALFVYLCISFTQLRSRRAMDAAGTTVRVRMWLFPWLTYATIAFILLILVMMAFDDGQSQNLWFSLAVAAIVLVAAFARHGFTGGSDEEIVEAAEQGLAEHDDPDDADDTTATSTEAHRNDA